MIAVLLALVVLLASCGGERPASSRPNVVLIMTDDQGYGDLSSTGNPILKTPRMDALAAESIRFTDFHVGPSCTPTRGQLLTGLDALRNGASSPTGQRHLLKRGLETMADVFRKNGYRTALYGKWHLGGNAHDFRPHERGFEDAVYFLRGGVQSHPNRWNSDLFDDELLHNGEYQPYPGYATDVWFDLGTEYVKARNQAGEAFFLYLPLNAPHGPLLAPDSYREPYRQLDKETATFFAMIATVDERLGDFVKMLEAEGLRDNTILIFLTDNGTANGEKIFNAGMRGKKGSLYEGGHRVPFWISWPGGNLRPPGDVDALAHAQDVLPTLIDLCGLEQKHRPAYDGVSLAPVLRGKPQPGLDERMLVVQRQESHGAGAVMWRKWRWVSGELYDLAADPGQATDVARENPELVRRFEQHYEQWWRGIEPGPGLEPYRIPGDGSETMLTAYDWWHGRRVFNWPHLRRGEKGAGYYEVLVDAPGRYSVVLRRWPRESGTGIRAAVPRHVATDGYMAGDEEIEPFPPGVALDIVGARVRFGDEERSAPVAADQQEVRFEFELPAGETTFQTWFTTSSGDEFGAYYAYIQAMDPSSQFLPPGRRTPVRN